MNDRHENRCANTEALNRYEKKQDRLAELLEEFQELAQPHLDIIEEQIFHLNNKAEAFEDLNLESEIRESVLEFLPYKKEKVKKTCQNCKHYNDTDEFFGGKCKPKNVNMDKDDGCLKGWEDD